MANDIDYIARIDQSVGKKIYHLRLINRVSGKKLAESIGVTCQQLYKYEKGINRLSLGKLFALTKALGITLEYFYQGLENTSADAPHQRIAWEVLENFMKIREHEKQQAICSLLRSLAKY